MPSDDERDWTDAPGETTREGSERDALYGDWSPDRGVPPLVVEIDGDPTRHRFTATFRIGRVDDCELVVDSPQVSRAHAEVYWANRRWRVRDLGSTNGTFLEGLRVETAELGARNALRLGAKGPVVWLSVEGAFADPPSVAHYLRRYVEGDPDQPEDGHTGMIRRAVGLAHRRQRIRFGVLLIAVSALLLSAAVVGWRYRVAQLERAQAAAEELFYTMKTFELRLAELEGRLAGTADPEAQTRLDEGRAQLGRMGDAYDRYLKELEVFSDQTPPESRAVLRIARVFGECEAAMPTGLVDEVLGYVDDWRSSTRLMTALDRAREHDYMRRAATAFDRVHLPPQYMLVALQESDFRNEACGPSTRYGIAKGAWQFIPGTARAYGLRVGPLYRQRRVDPEDERHDFDRAADAAARYLRDIYLREAQGSGLLVLAIYNYGGTNVRRLLRSLPETPSERNFWRVLLEHRDLFPPETYDYVLKIFAAAVILDDPRLFGFEFDPPLRGTAEAVPGPAA